MEIHKPKPVHSWREFLTEIGIIVIGVLIALSAEGIVEDLRWADRTRQTKEHLRAELHQIAVDALMQETFQPCARAMIHSLEQALANSADEWRPPFVETYRDPRSKLVTSQGRWEIPDGKGVIYVPEGRWETQAWLNAQADGTANHMSQEDNVAFGRLYELVNRRKALSDQQVTDLAELSALYLPQRLDPASRSEYLRVIGRVRYTLTTSAADDDRILEKADELNVPKPRVEEYGLETSIADAYCRQFNAGIKDIFFEFPARVFERRVQ